MAAATHTAPRNTPASPDSAARFEWQTWLLILAVYGSWLALITQYQRLPGWLATLLLVVVTSWFMSLQHELLHGHPTRSKALSVRTGSAGVRARARRARTKLGRRWRGTRWHFLRASAGGGRWRDSPSACRCGRRSSSGS